MNMDKAHNVVYDLTIGDSSILMELRFGKGLNKQSYKIRRVD